MTPPQLRKNSRMLQIDTAGRQRAITSSWPQLVDFLSQHPEWVLRKAEQLLSPMELMEAEEVTDPKEKALLLLNMFLKAADATVPVFEAFIQSVCMELNLPMELEIIFMSVSREDHTTQEEEDDEGATSESPSTSTKVERRRPWTSPPSRSNGKKSKQQRLDSAERYRELIITSMHQRYGMNRAVGATQGNDPPLAFSQAFVSLVIRQSRPWKTKERKEQVKEEPDAETHSDATMRLSDLFETVPTGTTKVVFLLGRPGVGKTRLVHKICQQWAERTLTQFQVVFLFEFRQLNLIERKLTLQELLFDFFLQPDVCPDGVFEHLLENCQQILVIFDGLDEFVENVHLPVSPAQVFSSGHLAPFSVAELLAGLCHGKLLPGCTVLVTTRPKLIPQELVRTVTLMAEIWGFDREKVEEYAECFFRHHSQRAQALACLKSNGKLLSMCYTPALCNIVCICLEYFFLHSAGSIQLPQTMTQFYIEMIQTFIRKQRKPSSPSKEAEWSQHQSALQGLSQLAFKGLEENKMLFYAAEVPKRVKEFASLYGLLLPFEVKARSGHTRAGYTFVHFGLQEFFSALFLLTSTSVDASCLKAKFFLRSKWLLKKEAKMPFTENSHVFLSGLASRECRPFLCSVAGQKETWIEERQAIVIQLLKKLANPQLTGPRIAELCHCVHEAQDRQLAQYVGRQLNFTYHFRNFRLMPLDVIALVFVISSTPDSVCLDFVGCTMELDYLGVLGSCENIKSLSFKSRKCGNEFAVVLSKSLPTMKCLETFQIAGGNITIQGLEHLTQAFPNCQQLQDINLQDNRMKQQELIKVTEIFSTMKQLKKLDLSGNEISVRTVLAFTEAAAVSQNVTQLHIRKKSLIVYFTSHAKRNPRLKDIEIKEEESVPDTRHLILRLQDCQLDSETAEDLARVLQRCPHLSEVDLSGNRLGDEGCSRLMKMMPQWSICGLLNLSNNQLSVKSVFYLLHSMSVYPTIMELNASIHDQTATLTLTSEESMDPTHSRNSSSGCDQLSSNGEPMAATPRKICLTHNDFQGDDLNSLCKALRGCHGITDLNLSSNSLGDAGLLRVLELLPDLKALRSLMLDNNDISLNGVFCLVQSFSVLESMTSMQLGLGSPSKVHISFGETARYSPAWEHQEDLREHAIHGRCFCLADGMLTAEDVGWLFGSLVKCSGLTEINLSRSLLNEQSVEQLLVFLPHLDSLKLLSITEKSLTQNSVLLLADSFNQCNRVCEVEVRSSKNATLHFVEGQENQEVHCKLVNCGIGQDDLKELCATLGAGAHLAEVDLSDNRLGNEGWRYLLEHLPKTQASCLIKISRNGISQDGILHLIHVLTMGPNIAEVHVSLCSEEIMFFTLLREDNPQKVLRLNHCNFQEEQRVRLIAGLEKCTTLSDLMSTNNGMTLSNVEDLFKALRKPIGMLRISIQEPWVGKESLTTLLKLAAEGQGNITTITREHTRWVVEQEFPLQVEQAESMIGSRFHPCESEASGVHFLPKFIGKCSQLRALNCSQVEITDAEAEMVSDALLDFPALKKLEFTCCRLPPAGTRRLAAALHQCSSIEEIDFSKSELGVDGARLLLKALEGKQYLKSINLGSLNLGKADILMLTGMLSTLSSLRRLSLTNNHLESKVCFHLAEVLKKAVHMEEINFSYNKIDDAGMKEIAAAILEMPNVKQINLKCNSIGCAGGRCFMEALAGCKNLEVLNLSRNRIGNEALEKLGALLPSLHYLKVLRLSSCNITFDGVAHLSRVFLKCQQIEQISLSANSLGDRGVTVLAEQLPQSSQLRKMKLKACEISDSASKSLAQGIHRCSLLEEINLSWNQLADEAALQLAKVLPGMAKLRLLKLENNCITPRGAERLAKELAQCRGIQSIRLWHNPIPKEAEQKLRSQEPRLHFSFF